jgi:hypothetical protein
LDKGFEERPSVPGASKTRVRETSIWRIDSSHQYPPERVGLGQRQRQPGHPPLKEHLQRARAGPVADVLQPARSAVAKPLASPMKAIPAASAGAWPIRGR